MSKLKIAGLFAGIGGLELGLTRAGHEAGLLCEIEEGARTVLADRFGALPLERDVTQLASLPSDTDLVAAGFPCQDLSQAGATKGIDGSRSSLVNEVFRLVREHRTPHVLLENVSFMLQLGRGQAIRHVVDHLESLGYAWAYRVLDSRAFGLPQRRERVFLFASRETRPWEHLFQEDTGDVAEPEHAGRACGFYWTEGIRGLGWAIDAVPTLKGGSTIGIPSSPAIWMPDGRIVTPDIRDAERMQGFEADWTIAVESRFRSGHRWKLVGNAVSVDAAEWVGRAIAHEPERLSFETAPFDQQRSWPRAAFGAPGETRQRVAVSAWPVRRARQPLLEFLRYEPKPLSHKAVSGFLQRLDSGSLRYPPAFRQALVAHRDGRARLELERKTA